jgi:PKD repeat protein
MGGTGKADLVVQFMDRSINATGWYWDLGDGTTSTEKNPINLYHKGTYNVTLTANNDYGNASITKTNCVVVLNQSIVLFNATPTDGGNIGDSILFEDQSTESPATWYWEFGDGEISIEQNPTHIYSKNGGYSINLTVTNLAGTSSNTRYNYVHIGPIPASDFIANITNDTEPMNVTFTPTDLSAASYLWNFGDNQVSTEQEPTHTYGIAGHYTITLTTTNAAGSNSTVKYGYIRAGEVEMNDPGNYSQYLSAAISQNMSTFDMMKNTIGIYGYVISPSIFWLIVIGFAFIVIWRVNGRIEGAMIFLLMFAGIFGYMITSTYGHYVEVLLGLAIAAYFTKFVWMDD